MKDTTAAIVSDLRVLLDQAKWAHVHGYVKEGHGLDAERGADLSRTEADRESGPVFDIEVGSHPARVAYQAAAKAVSDADRILAAVLAGEGSWWQPPVRALPVAPSTLDLSYCVKKATWRAERITDDHRQLGRVRQMIDTAVRGLSKALDAGPPEGITPARCVTCKIRERAERPKSDGTMRASKAGECDVCAQYRYRNGEQRPTELDTGPVNEARAAQARRIARGESWGVA